ncbi:MAG: OmpA family protein [Flavobacteriales bacterium]|nr:OmpA family protein [Flavobacteriales bacterium]
MLRNPNRTIVPLLFSLLIVACVPARKYEETDRRAKALQQEVEGANAKALEAQTRMGEMSADLSGLNKRVGELERDTTVLGTSLRKMTVQYDKINALNDELLSKYNALLAGNSSENRKLLTDLEAMRLDLQNKEDSVNALAKRVGEKQAALAALQAEIDAKDAAMKDLKNRVSQALSGFEGKGLTVEQRNGRIYVSMDNKLLFPSGSAAVDAKGREAIGKLAKAIENEKDLSILVEGHTDTDKIGSGSAYKDNWDLSVMRATSVVRIMQESSKTDPVRITAAGRGEYVPVDPNDKAKNRRIEVVLIPDLKELYKLVKE